MLNESHSRFLSSVYSRIQLGGDLSVGVGSSPIIEKYAYIFTVVDAAPPQCGGTR